MGSNLGKIFEQMINPLVDLVSYLLNALIKVKFSGENIKYLSTVLIVAFKDVKLTDEKKKKKIRKILVLLNFVNVFIGTKLKL